MSRIILIFWAMLGVLGLGLLLGLVATARSRSDLADIVYTADQSRLTAIEYDAANALLHRELSSAHCDPRVLSAIWGVLAVRSDAERTRSLISRRSDDLLAKALASTQPDEASLRLAYDVAAVLGPEVAAAAHARIAARAEFRGEAAMALTAAAERLRSSDTGVSTVASIARVSQAWDALLHAGSGAGGLTWAARETPPVSDAIATAGEALRAQLDVLLAADGDAQGEAVRATWACLQRVGYVQSCPPQLVARYAEAVRREHIPSSGLFIAVVVFLFLASGTGLACHRLMRGVRRIDPAAETMEAVDPVDTDTEAITVERNPTSEETKVD